LTKTLLNLLEKKASSHGLLLRLKIGHPLSLWTFRVVVAETIDTKRIKVLGEMKGWAYNKEKGLQLDTMQVRPSSRAGVGSLIWAATMAWALENTSCRYARLLAVNDEDQYHSKLLRYFRLRGFVVVKEVGSSALDLPLRTVWGGAGSLMVARCSDVYERSIYALQKRNL